jgi:hypothetical protein
VETLDKDCTDVREHCRLSTLEWIRSIARQALSAYVHRRVLVDLFPSLVFAAVAQSRSASAPQIV